MSKRILIVDCGGVGAAQLLGMMNGPCSVGGGSGDAPKPWFDIQAKAGSKSADVFIFDTIGEDYYGGVSAKGFAEELNALEGVTDLNVHINSPGGSVFDGVAIYNLLAKHEAAVNVHIEGMALSIASIIAMAGDTVTIAENAMLMIHNPWQIAVGDAIELRKTADMMDVVKGQMVATYKHKTGLEDSLLSDMMDEETWLTGDEAVAQGFADTVSSPMAMAACAAFDYSGYKHTPEALLAKGRKMHAKIKAPDTVQVKAKGASRRRHLDLLELEL